MNFKKLAVIGLGLVLVCGLVGSVSALYNGYTCEQCTYTYGSPEWVQDVQANIYPLITQSGKSFDERIMLQAYALGWDERFDIIEQYGEIDYENEIISYNLPWHYDISAFFGSVPSRETLFTNTTDYNTVMVRYNNNYALAVQKVPFEV